MKKILALGLMFAVFAPFSVFAYTGCLKNDDTGNYYLLDETGAGGSCNSDTGAYTPASAPVSNTPTVSNTATYNLEGTNSLDTSGISGTDTSGSTYDFTLDSTVTYTTPSSDTGLAGGTKNVTYLFSFLTALLTSAVKLILAAAVVFFLWGVFQFVRAAGNEEVQTEGKSHIIYGIIGIAVMVSMWGLVNFITGSANLDTTDIPTVPALITQ